MKKKIRMYEVLQCGLSWDTIIQKRAAFRIAFERFYGRFQGRR